MKRLEKQRADAEVSVHQSGNGSLVLMLQDVENALERNVILHNTKCSGIGNVLFTFGNKVLETTHKTWMIGRV